MSGIRFISYKLLKIFMDILTGIFVVSLNLLAVYIYMNKEDFILGNWSIYLVAFVFVITAYLIGKGVKHSQYRKGVG